MPERSNFCLSRDELFNLLEFFNDCDFIQGAEFNCDDLNVFYVNRKLLETFNCVLNRTDLLSHWLTYHKFFLLEPFYLSFLAFAETEFEGKPIIISMFFIHTREKEDTHEYFSRRAVKLLPELLKPKKTFLVSDHETAIINAIGKYLPKLTIEINFARSKI